MTAHRPLPRPDNVTAPYWDAAARGELLIQRCTHCGRHQFYPRAACTACAGDPEWVRASGRGTVYTFTVIRQNGSPPFDRLSPYVVALVDLEEGVRMTSNVVDCPVDDVYIGMPVEVDLREEADGVHLPLWRPAAP